MLVYVKSTNGVEAVNMEKDMTIVNLKEQLGIDEYDVFFTKGSEALDECASIEDGDVIDVNFRLPGGKVHGSLARAGKVRAQTPKVDKTEKKKKATGRSHRRVQYNRRFVNVAVSGMGRKRGPNSNTPV